MTKGRNEEALNVFRTMYAMNTRNPKETYSVLLINFEKFTVLFRNIAFQIVYLQISELKTDFPTHQPEDDNVKVAGITEINLTKNPLQGQTGPFKLLFSKSYISLTLRVLTLKFFMLFG